MVLAKSAEEMHHTENVVSLICGAAVLIACAILLAIFLEKRISEWEERQRIIELQRLQRIQNEKDAEKDNYRFVDQELKSIIFRQKKEITEKNLLIDELYEEINDYKQQLNDIRLGTIKNQLRGKKHA